MVEHTAKERDALIAYNLPEIIRTLSGIELDPRQDVWGFRDALNTIHLDFREISANTDLVLGAKTVLAWYAENLSSSSVRCV